MVVGYVASWQMVRLNMGAVAINGLFLKLVILATLLICGIYFVAYQMGSILYFGMGLQTFITVALVLALKYRFRYQILVLASIFLTGKRSSFLIYLGQLFGPKMSKGVSLRNFTYGILISGGLLGVAYSVGLLERFTSLVDLFVKFDAADPELNRSLLFYASSGRTEEIYAYFVDSDLTILQHLIGQNADTPSK